MRGRWSVGVRHRLIIILIMMMINSDLKMRNNPPPPPLPPGPRLPLPGDDYNLSKNFNEGIVNIF